MSTGPKSRSGKCFKVTSLEAAQVGTWEVHVWLDPEVGSDSFSVSAWTLVSSGIFLHSSQTARRNTTKPTTRTRQMFNHHECRQISLCFTTHWYVTASYHQASVRHSAGWNRQQILQQTGKTLPPLVSPTCSRQVGSVNETIKPHRLTKFEKTAYRPVLTRSGQSTETVSSRMFQQGLYQGPNARKEAEEGERMKWIELLGSMLAHTPTPMGALLAAQPANFQLLGAGRRAATLRSRVRAVKRFLDWLAVSHGQGYPTELHDYTGLPASAPVRTMHTRSAERRTQSTRVRGRSRRSHSTVTESQPPPVHLVIQKELLANSIPGRPAKQAPRMFISMLAALEELTVNDKALPYYRVYRMVDSSPVMGHDALQRPSWPQAKRHSRDKQHDVRQVDEVKNHRR